MTKTKVNTILDIILVLVLIPIFFVKGEIHQTLAYTLAGLAALHMVLHWQQFMIMYRKLIPSVGYRRAVSAMLIILIIAAFAVPGFLPQGGHGPDGFQGHPGQYQNRGFDQHRD